VPVGRFAALKPGGRAAVFADAEAAPVKEPSAHKVDGVLAASARCKTAPGDESAARTPNGAVAAFADTAAGFLALEPPRATRLFKQDCHRWRCCPFLYLPFLRNQTYHTYDVILVFLRSIHCYLGRHYRLDRLNDSTIALTLLLLL